MTRSLITAEACGAGTGGDDKTVDTRIDSILDAFHDQETVQRLSWPRDTFEGQKMTNLKNGFMVGFVSTVVLTVLMVAKGMMGVMPALDVAAMLSMMIVVMPMAGAGFFGINLGMMAPVMTLVLHIIFGVVLGKVYALLPATAQTA